jgi:polyvinyl alcohol dehydrogenase (cytochrome)
MTGFAGAGLWGSQPAIDSARNQVFVATGNLYGEVPAAYKACTTAACLPTDVLTESIIAIDLTTGKLNWAKQMNGPDGWSFACIKPYSTTEGDNLCPSGPGPDADFAMAPTFVPAALGGTVFETDSVLVGEKSGYVYSFSAADGTLQWTSDPSPPQNLGGVSMTFCICTKLTSLACLGYGSR